MLANLSNLLHLLAAALTPAENALLLKTVRVETRQRRPLLAILGVSLTLALTCAAVWWIWLRLPLKITHWLMMHNWSIVRVAMVACVSLHCYIVLFTVASRNQRFFLKEAQQNTLEQLLLTPLSAAELLLRITTHTFYYGMLLALIGLPLYAFWALMGDLTWWQLLVLYLLFARLSFTPPSPQQYVMLWRLRQTGQQTAAQRKRLRQQSAPFGIAIMFFNIAMQVFFQVFMRQRWFLNLLRRLWQMLPAVLKGILPTAWFTWLYCAVVLFTLPMAWFRFHLPPIVFALPLLPLGRVLAILRGAVFMAGNLPLMTAPPGSPPPASEAPSPYVQQTQRRIAQLEAVFNFALSLALIGYFWKPLIANGGLAWLVSKTASDSAHALAGWMFCLGGISVLQTVYALRDYLTAGFRVQGLGFRETSPLPIFQPSNFQTFKPLATSVLFLSAACLMGGVSPFNHPTLLMAGKLLVLGAATAAFCLSARWWQARVTAARPPREETEDSADAWIVTYPQWAHWWQRHGVWFSNAAWRVTWLLVLVVWVYPFVALLHPQPMMQLTAAVSPVISFASLSPRANELLQSITVVHFAPLPPWWTGLLLQPLVALAWCALALRLRPYRSRVLLGARESKIGWWARLSARVKVGNERLIARLSDELSARFDNPVAVKDLRVRARRENWAAQQITTLLIGWFIVLTALSALTWAVLFAPVPPNRFLLTTLLAQVCPELGTLSVPAQMFLSVLVPVWAIGWFVTWIWSIQPGTAFDNERDSSTLGFLLTTPLSDRDIIVGKWLGFTVDAWLAFALTTPLSLLLALAVTVSGAPQVLLVYVAAEVFFVALLCAGAALGVALSARFKARGAGAGWSVVAMILLQGVVVSMISMTAYHHLPFVAYTLPFLLGALLHAALGVLALRWGARVIGRIRVGDVAFEGLKREN